MNLYRIKNWDKVFENSRSREIDNCTHAFIPNKQHGMGFTFIISQKDGASILGIWYLIVEACSMQKRPRQGYLTDTGTADGRQWTADTLALRWRRPKIEIERALNLLCSQDIDWMEVTEITAGGRQMGAVEVPDEGKGIELNGREGNRREGKKVRACLEYRPVSECLLNSLKQIGMQPVETNLPKWDDTVRLMVERDKRTPEDIISLINECREHKGSNGFTWSTNIRSMETLRERWNENKIFLGMNSRAQTAQPRFGRQEVTDDQLMTVAKELKERGSI